MSVMYVINFFYMKFCKHNVKQCFTNFKISYKNFIHSEIQIEKKSTLFRYIFLHVFNVSMLIYETCATLTIFNVSCAP